MTKLVTMQSVLKAECPLRGPARQRQPTPRPLAGEREPGYCGENVYRDYDYMVVADCPIGAEPRAGAALRIVDPDDGETRHVRVTRVAVAPGDAGVFIVGIDTGPNEEHAWPMYGKLYAVST